MYNWISRHLRVFFSGIAEDISFPRCDAVCFGNPEDLSKNLKIKIYKSIILPVVLYGYVTWSLTLREERRLRVLENRVLRRIFGPKRDEVTGEWGKLHNEEPNDLYCSPNIVRVIKSKRIGWAWHVVCRL